jgi:hypothetical protein
MPANMALAALLMSGATQTGQPTTKLTLGGDVISQPNGGAPTVTLAATHGKGGEKSYYRRGKLSAQARQKLLAKPKKPKT